MLSQPQRKALDNLRCGRSISDHVKGRSQSGGFSGTVQSLISKGLITPDHELTTAGRVALEQDDAEWDSDRTYSDPCQTRL